MNDTLELGKGLDDCVIGISFCVVGIYTWFCYILKVFYGTWYFLYWYVSHRNLVVWFLYCDWSNSKNIFGFLSQHSLRSSFYLCVMTWAFLRPLIEESWLMIGLSQTEFKKDLIKSKLKGKAYELTSSGSLQLLDIWSWGPLMSNRLFPWWHPLSPYKCTSIKVGAVLNISGGEQIHSHPVPQALKRLFKILNNHQTI